MTKRGSITRILAWLSGLMIFMMVLFIPLGYFLLSYQYAAGSIGAEAEINARIITQIISANPKLWEFEQVRVQEYLTRRSKQGYAEIRRVLNMNNELVAESADPLDTPVMMKSVELFDSGHVVGRVEICRSLRPLLVMTGLLGLCMLPLGALVFVVIRKVPLRAILLAEALLKKERDTAQKYLDIAGVLFVVLDAAQRVTLINRKGCEVLARTEEQILQKNWFDNFVPVTGRESAREFFIQLCKGPAGQNALFESPVVTPGGEERMIDWHLVALTGADGAFAGGLCSGTDITERRSLEEQLLHAQKMEAIGVLAGGVAHDFNNILAAIIGYASLLQIKITKDEPLRHPVDQIINSAERAAKLTKSLLAYSRKQIFDPKPIKINDLLRDVEKLLPRLVREDIEIRTVLSDNQMTVNADAASIEQVLMNLATNARDSMPDGGQLIIETRCVELGSESIAAHGYGIQGTYALIAVSDTGMGMTPETKAKIFDPFFTTKEVGKGTGLGLSMVYGIIKNHHGFVNVYSEIGKGTTFKIYLPLVQMTVQDERRVESQPPAGGTETVLVAEDDPAVRTMTGFVLREAGYTVIEARDGEDAVQMFAAHRQSIQLVMLDVIMPKKNGKIVLDEIKGVRPDIKVLFTSGYTAEVMKGMKELGAGVHFLPKPASSAELLRKVRAALDE
jgi:PAS domain S-box-containing protein